jgi:hypothetical protein
VYPIGDLRSLVPIPYAPRPGVRTRDMSVRKVKPPRHHSTLPASGDPPHSLGVPTASAKPLIYARRYPGGSSPCYPSPYIPRPEAPARFAIEEGAAQAPPVHPNCSAILSAAPMRAQQTGQAKAQQAQCHRRRYIELRTPGDSGAVTQIAPGVGRSVGGVG